MKKIYYLGTCDTCRRIMKEIDVDDTWRKREIKSEPLDENELDDLKRLANSFESLFSKRSRHYRSMGLHEKDLREQDIKSLILSEYTFLKRPVIVVDGQIFIGNNKQTVEEVKKTLANRNYNA